MLVPVLVLPLPFRLDVLSLRLAYGTELSLAGRSRETRTRRFCRRDCRLLNILGRSGFGD
jgi:hypothetical protein